MNHIIVKYLDERSALVHKESPCIHCSSIQGTICALSYSIKQSIILLYVCHTKPLANQTLVD